MIHEIAPSRFCNAFSDVLPDSTSIVLYYQDDLSLVSSTSQGIQFARYKDVEHLLDREGVSCTYLFSIDNERYYLMSNKVTQLENLPGFHMETINIFRNSSFHVEAFAGAAGYQLYRWYETNKYCGFCRELLKKDSKERMLYCDRCNQQVFPRLNPAVIVGVTNKNKILLTKYANSNHNRYALVAGFVEFGESLEEAVCREVMEEVGLKVTNVRYYKSQPWPFTDSLLMGFFCDLAGENGQVSLDEEELSVASWFEREDIPVKPSRDSLTNEMIMSFKNKLI